MGKFQISTDQVKANIQALQKFMQDEKLDAFYISSYDPYLNEYVPMSDCHRFYFTGFSGSVAEVLVPSKGKVKVYVDGRYHEQADLECDTSVIEVVKVPANTGLMSCLKDDLKKLSPKVIGLEADRTAVSFYEYLQAHFEVRAYMNNELASIVDFAEQPKLKKIVHLEKKLRGADTSEKLERIFESDKDAYFITAIDSLAWLTNCRGYHIPNSSSFLGVGFAVRDKVHVFIGKDVAFECSDKNVEFHQVDISEIEGILQKLGSDVEKVYIDKQMLNSNYFEVLKSVFGKDKLENKTGGLVEFHSLKDDTEIEVMKDSFRRADQAIFNTIKWVKDSLKKGDEISERDLYNKTTEEYKKQGAQEQSFNTIAGVGPNGSIMHYGDPKDSVKIVEGDMCLLDSGGYFEAGFATDTTRTFLSTSKPKDEKYKEIYTLVLKGTLNLQNAVFKSGTRGSGLDAIARQPLHQAGYDFAHGTGHGVGIHVHEGGVGISPVRNYLLKPGQVVSIEPGIYIPKFGGVRLENIALVVEHPEYEGFLKFEPLVYIGFEPGLIDESLLNSQEKKWLDEYEAVCRERGTSFNS
ncbi:MAG: hypothetical protein CME62_15295 [Halobacteriovoraceae bacterium]|nr:hypothetical protein [Halobacteriovoraceae bacterium]|tara:strand:- start:5930 stop:7663 length:1734 start_codon:yes stop_codon:yes gene_type:complete